MWQMLLPWWPDGIATRVNLVLIQMLYVRPHPIYEADGICLCFYLGMGH